MRKAYIRIKLPEQLVDYVAYVANNRLLGYRSMIEFVASATRKEVQRLRSLGFIPPVVPKVREVPIGAIGTVVIVILAALLGLWYTMPAGLTGMSVLEEAFSPLAGWHVGDVYERYQGFINFALYFVAFLAITFSASKRWLDRREAILLATAFSLALAIGLAFVPTNWIKQLSPVALLVLVLVLFCTLLDALRRLGFAWISGGSIAFIFAYFLIRTHQQDLFVSAGVFGASLNLVFLITFFAAATKAVFGLFKRFEPGFVRVKHVARMAWGDAVGSPAEHALVKKEQEELAQFFQIQPMDYKELGHVERDLEAAEKAVRQYGYSQQGLDLIASELVKLRDQESEVDKKLEDLHSLAERMNAIDLDLFTKLKRAFGRLPEQERKKAKKMIQQKVSELNLETALPHIADSAGKTQSQITTALTNAISELRRGQPHDALRWLNRTRFYVAQLCQLLTQVNDTEQAIKATLGQTLQYFIT